MDFYGRGGLRPAYQEIGQGRPLILSHGHQDWGTHRIDSALAGRLAARRYRVTLPGLRAHGDSAKPHDAAWYPADVRTNDRRALIDHLGAVKTVRGRPGFDATFSRGVRACQEDGVARR